jgi:hypothetical protein
MTLSREPSLFQAVFQPDSITATGPTVVTTLEELNAPVAKSVHTTITENEIRLVTILAGDSGEGPTPEIWLGLTQEISDDMHDLIGRLIKIAHDFSARN